MFEIKVQSPEVVMNDYDGLPKGVLDFHDQWSRQALHISAHVPALSNKVCEDIQKVASVARSLSLQQLRKLPGVAKSVLHKHQSLLAYNSSAALDIGPADFARGTFTFGKTDDSEEYRFSARIPEFETFFADICVSTLNQSDNIDKGVLRREYDKTLETATGAFSTTLSQSFAQRFERLDHVEPDYVAQATVPSIAKEQNQFFRTRLQDITNAAEILPEQTRTQRVFRSIGRIATGGFAYADQANQRKQLAALIAQDLTANERDFGADIRSTVESWLIENEYLKHDDVERKEIEDLYDNAAEQVLQELEALKQQFALQAQPLAHNEQVPESRFSIVIPQDHKLLADIAGRVLQTPDDLVAAAKTLAEKNGGNKARAFKRLVSQLLLHPDSSPYPAEVINPFFIALTTWRDAKPEEE